MIRRSLGITLKGQMCSIRLLISMIGQVLSAVSNRRTQDGLARRWPKRTPGRLGLVTSVAALLAATLVFVAPGVSQAGTNGQQLVVFNYDAHSIEICGFNQNGQAECPKFNLSFVYGEHFINGWWWKGLVTVGYYSGYNESGLIGNWQANVPTVQFTGDYYCVSEYLNGGTSNCP
jgi:hypothetical protein